MDAETSDKQGVPPPGKLQAKKPARLRYLDRWASLDNEYSTWRTRHMEIIDYIQPDRGAFVGRDQHNRGTRKDSLIYDSTACDAEKKLAAAMDTGISSPVRKWFRLTAEGIVRSNFPGGQAPASAEYLDAVEEALFSIFAKSNLYWCLGNLYRDLVGPGTGVVVLEPDLHTVVRGQHLPIGRYRLGSSGRGRVDVLFDRPWFTVAQIVSEFGYDKCSPRVKQAWDENHLEEWYEVMHVIEPRDLRVLGAIDAENKPWASSWMEVAAPDGYTGFLRVSGFDKKPFAAARWDVVGSNAYGTDSPSMQAIGDVKQLQATTIETASMIALMRKPAMSEPSGMKNASLVPGARNKLPNNSQQKFEPSYEVRPEAVTVSAAEKQELRSRIRDAFMTKLLYTLTGDQASDVQKTAEEIRARKDEALLQLSSAYKIFSDEVLDPLVDFVLYEAQQQGLIPLPPEDFHQVHATGELHAPVRVEYINNLAQAQKLLGISAVERIVNAALGMFQGTQDQSILDNIDFDQAIHILAETLGVKPSLIRADDVVKAMRAARAQQQQAAQQAQALQSGAKAMKDIGSTDPEQLNQLVQQYGPQAGAQVRF